MSVKVESLTKIYGSQRALDNISFEVLPGEIVGFLGPNGAGKSTTMKILTGYIPASSGKALVCGMDAEAYNPEVRRMVGYLPEHNPLYLDMYIKEYLHMIAGIYSIKKRETAVKDIIHKTGLQPEQKKKIGQLSKGYRQRVGLAAALIHEPKVLILDEPTSGLDPNQIMEIRNLITQLGQDKTIMLSTHIMQEVQAICNRVLIINKGKLVADNKVENIQQQSGENMVEVEFGTTIDSNLILKMPGVNRVQQLTGNQYQIHTAVDVDIRERLFKLAVENNWTLLSIKQQKISLEEIFRKVTSQTPPSQ